MIINNIKIYYKITKTYQSIKNLFRLKVPGLLMLVFISLIVLSSCTFFSFKNKCERIIEKDKMVEIMTDIYLLEGYVQVRSRTVPEVRDSADYYYSALFKKHDITKETFDKAFDCYSLDRELMLSLNEEVLNSIRIIEGHTADEEFIPEEPVPADMPAIDE